VASERTRLAIGLVLAALAGLCGIVSGCSRATPAAAKEAGSGPRPAASEVSPALPKEGPLPGRALIYAEMQGKQAGRSVALCDLSWHVMWLPGAGGGPARTVYVGGPKRVFNGRLPAHLGFIPSPDGRWLCVWETHYGPRGQWSDALQTVWTMVKLPEGSKPEIHVQPGLAGHFPLWLDNHRLQLEKGGPPRRLRRAHERAFA
jgi:hypothetical protein